MKGVLSCLVCWARRAGTRDCCPALAGLVRISINFSPSPSKLDIQYCGVVSIVYIKENLSEIHDIWYFSSPF
jgi:hypothetical protein